ncbi:MAG: DNA oxidative demethylase AlkB [Polyangiaceae bacterium]|nr:DNA oxidative demethylase AlkB [Polyangiaceae bacterium]
MVRTLFELDDDVALAPGAWWLRGFARAMAGTLLAEIDQLAAAAPFRHMTTPGGKLMSAAMTSAGALGWVSDRAGYRYSPVDPRSGAPWPPMPDPFALLAGRAAERAGYAAFVPDSCLVNLYEQGARMGVHQDRDERDLSHPIVSVSLGASARFTFGPARGATGGLAVELSHGDVVVWGGASRLYFHAVTRVRDDAPRRLNLTLRRAG